MSRAWQRTATLWAAAACAALLLAAGARAADAPPAALDQLMALLAQQRHAEADFDERQYLAVLTRPLISSGVLIYDAPSHLEQRTLRPRRQTMVLDHGTLTMQIGRRRRSVPLADYPQLAPLIDSIRATLAGDRAALEQRFELQLHGTLEHWQLRLTPREPQLSAGVSDIVIDGAQAQISEVRVRQSDGDHSVLQIRPRP
ncbi:MAG TPA: LolA-related protein [Steroidobacteraceae bacterium]|jgi:outer membrane lipoprotein-sorting protein|nr:LolA-related protein [Steroidobacteraceae bacterium]